MPFPNPATQFKPGNPGGPGRPKGRSLTGLLCEALEQDDGTGRKPADRLVEVLLRIALDGDRQAIKDVFDRVEGKVPDTIEVKTEDTSAVEGYVANLKEAYGKAPE